MPVERERRAYFCPHKDHDIPPRVFLLPGEQPPVCHGRRMVQQANVPYDARKVAASGARPVMLDAPRPRPKRPKEGRR